MTLTVWSSYWVLRLLTWATVSCDAWDWIQSFHARQAVFPALTCISKFSTGRNEWGRKGRNGESAGGRRLGRVGRFLEPMLWPAFEGWEPTDWSLTTGEQEQGERPSPFVLSHQLGWVCGGPPPRYSAQAPAITFMELCLYVDTSRSASPCWGNALYGPWDGIINKGILIDIQSIWLI